MDQKGLHVSTLLCKKSVDFLLAQTNQGRQKQEHEETLASDNYNYLDSEPSQLLAREPKTHTGGLFTSVLFTPHIISSLKIQKITRHIRRKNTV